MGIKMIVARVFITVRNWEQLKCPRIRECNLIGSFLVTFVYLEHRVPGSH